jgi:hypothetical protein
MPAIQIDSSTRSILVFNCCRNIENIFLSLCIVSPGPTSWAFSPLDRILKGYQAKQD